MAFHTGWPSNLGQLALRSLKQGSCLFQLPAQTFPPPPNEIERLNKNCIEQKVRNLCVDFQYF